MELPLLSVTLVSVSWFCFPLPTAYLIFFVLLRALLSTEYNGNFMTGWDACSLSLSLFCHEKWQTDWWLGSWAKTSYQIELSSTLQSPLILYLCLYPWYMQTHFLEFCLSFVRYHSIYFIFAFPWNYALGWPTNNNNLDSL